MADDPKQEKKEPETGAGDGQQQKKSLLRKTVGDVVFTNPLTGNDTNLTQAVLNIPGALKSKLENLWKNDTSMSDPIETVEVDGIGVCIETKSLLGHLYQALGKTFINYWWAKSATDLQTDNSRSVVGTATRKSGKAVGNAAKKSYNWAKDQIKGKAPVAESIEEIFEEDEEKAEDEKEIDPTDARSDAETKNELNKINAEFKRERKNFKADLGHKPNVRVAVNGMDFDQYLKMIRSCPINVLKKGGTDYLPTVVAKMRYRGNNQDVPFLAIYACENESQAKARIKALETAFWARKEVNEENPEKSVSVFPGASPPQNLFESEEDPRNGILADFVLEDVANNDKDQLKRALKSIFTDKTDNGPDNNLGDAEPTTFEFLEKAMNEYKYVQFFIDDGNLALFDKKAVEEKIRETSSGALKEAEEVGGEGSGEKSQSGQGNENKKMAEMQKALDAEAQNIIPLYNQTGNIVCAICDTAKMMKDISGRLLRSGKNEHNNANVKSADDFKLGMIYTKVDQNGGPKMSTGKAREIEARKKQGQYAESNFGERSTEAEKNLADVWYDYSNTDDPNDWDNSEAYLAAGDKSDYRQFNSDNTGTIAANGKSTDFKWESDGKFIKISVPKENPTQVYCRKYKLENGILEIYGTVDGKEQILEKRIGNRALKNRELKKKIANFKGPWTVTDGTSYTFGIDNGNKIKIMAESLILEDDNSTETSQPENGENQEKNRSSDNNGITIDSIEQDKDGKKITVNLQGHEAITITPDTNDPTKISEINGQKATNKPQKDKDDKKEAEEGEAAKKEMLEKVGHGKEWLSNAEEGKERRVFKFEDDAITIEQLKKLDEADDAPVRKQYKSIRKEGDNKFFMEIDGEKNQWTLEISNPDSEIKLNGSTLSRRTPNGKFKDVEKIKRKWTFGDISYSFFNHNTGEKDDEGNDITKTFLLISKGGEAKHLYTVKFSHGDIKTTEVQIKRKKDGKISYAQPTPIEGAKEETLNYSYSDGQLKINTGDGESLVLRESINLDIAEPTGEKSIARQIVIESTSETVKRHYLEVEEPCQ